MNSDTFIRVWRWGFAFRVNGHGLRLLSHRHTPALYSERNGRSSAFHVGRWCLLPLRPVSTEGPEKPA